MEPVSSNMVASSTNSSIILNPTGCPIQLFGERTDHPVFMATFIMPWAMANNISTFLLGKVTPIPEPTVTTPWKNQLEIRKAQDRQTFVFEWHFKS
jgi:hypothetical protein